MELYSPERAIELIEDNERTDLPVTSPDLAALAVEIPLHPIDPLLPELLPQAARILIGVCTARHLPPAPRGFDILLTDRRDAPPPWVACDDLDSSLADLERTVASFPLASLCFVQVLRAGHRLELPSALLLESFAFSTLLAGPEFRAWLAGRRRPSFHEAPDPDPPVQVDRHGSTLDILLCRPQVHNAVNASMRDALVETLDVPFRDSSIEAVHLRGAGPSFSSGGDLSEFGTAEDPSNAHLVRTVRSPVFALARCPQAVTAFVHGACIGAGLELAAQADRIVAHPDTSFALPEIGMGLLPGAGGTATIPRRIGRSRTAYLALSRRAVEVDTARAWGLVDDVDPRERG